MSFAGKQAMVTGSGISAAPVAGRRSPVAASSTDGHGEASDDTSFQTLTSRERNMKTSIPSAPRALPLLGHTLPLLRDPLGFLSSLPAFGDLVRIRAGSFEAVVVCDPSLTHQVLTEDSHFDKGGRLFERIREVIGNGVVTCPHDDHRRLHGLTQPALHRSRLPRYAETMRNQITATTDSWHDGQILDVLAEMYTLTMQVGVETMFSDSLSAADAETTLNDVITVMRGMYRRAIVPPIINRLPTRKNRRYHQARTRIRAMLREIIANRRINNTDHGDLLSALLAAEYLPIQNTRARPRTPRAISPMPKSVTRSSTFLSAPQKAPPKR